MMIDSGEDERSCKKQLLPHPSLGSVQVPLPIGLLCLSSMSNQCCISTNAKQFLSSTSIKLSRCFSTYWLCKYFLHSFMCIAAAVPTKHRRLPPLVYTTFTEQPTIFRYTLSFHPHSSILTSPRHSMLHRIFLLA